MRADTLLFVFTYHMRSIKVWCNALHFESDVRELSSLMWRGSLSFANNWLLCVVWGTAAMRVFVVTTMPLPSRRASCRVRFFFLRVIDSANNLLDQ